MVKNHASKLWAVILDIDIKLRPRDSDLVVTPEVKDAILAIYQVGATDTQVAVYLGLTLDEYIRTRARIPELDHVCQYGHDLARSALEEIALRGAKGEIRNFNNTMLQFLLKCQYPDQYGDKKDGSKDSDSLLEQLTAGSLKLVRENE